MLPFTTHGGVEGQYSACNCLYLMPCIGAFQCIMLEIYHAHCKRGEIGCCSGEATVSHFKIYCIQCIQAKMIAEFKMVVTIELLDF